MLDAIRSGHGLFVTELFEHLISGMGMLLCQSTSWVGTLLCTSALGGHVTAYKSSASVYIKELHLSV
jgi:hypothetical protein